MIVDKLSGSQALVATRRPAMRARTRRSGACALTQAASCRSASQAGAAREAAPAREAMLGAASGPTLEPIRVPTFGPTFGPRRAVTIPSLIRDRWGWIDE